jgi:hypothetical protein
LVRGDALDVYTVQMSKGSYFPFVQLLLVMLTPSAAPSQADIRLALTEQENSRSQQSGSIGLLCTGLNLEEDQ